MMSSHVGAVATRITADIVLTGCTGMIAALPSAEAAAASKYGAWDEANAADSD
jgi:deoxycytidylate deaminase